MKKDTSTVLDALVTRASLTDAILELVKESGLLKPRKRHYTKRAKGTKKAVKRVAKPAVKREAKAPRPNGRDQDERPVRRTVEPARATRPERELEDRD